MISHLRKFGCAVYVPISPPQRTTMEPHRKLGIYVGYEMLTVYFGAPSMFITLWFGFDY
jgi:hypothetical protein